MRHYIRQAVQAGHREVLHAALVPPKQLQERVHVFWVVRQHALEREHFALNVVVQRIQPDLVHLTLL